MSNVAILQARFGSSRLPGKVLAEVNGRPMIEWQIRRIKESKIDDLIIATSDRPEDNLLAEVCKNLGVQVFRGSQHDVHSRFYRIVKGLNPEYFVRITGDCPLVMPDLLDEMLAYFRNRKCDYLSNTNPPTYPDGLDLEIVSTDAFLDFSSNELSEEEKEHVTLGIYQSPGKFQISNFENNQDLSRMRWTVDYQEDLDFIRDIYGQFVDRELTFKMKDVLGVVSSGRVRENKKNHNFRNLQLKKDSRNV